jgi:hypothetical protein
MAGFVGLIGHTGGVKPKPQRARVDGLKQLNWHHERDAEQPLWLEPAEIARQLHYPLNTIRSWARRGVIGSACCLQSGRLMVNLVDVKARTACRGQAA